MNKKLKVLLIYDDAKPLEEGVDYSKVLEAEHMKAEAHVYEALLRLGHEVRLFAVTNSVEAILEEVRKNPPDVVFNQAEQFCGDSEQEKNIMGLFEMLQIPYTGTGSVGLMLCKNKALTKKILTHHRIKTPDFVVFHKGSRIHIPKKLQYPLIVKPLREEASYGISMNSWVDQDKSLKERIQFVHESMNQDVIVEEYVEGRELYVGILGNHRPQVLPAREMVFEQVPEDEPKIATFKAKWDEKYRKRWGIKNKSAVLGEEVTQKIERLSKNVFHYLYLKGYARLDLRLNSQKEVVVIEVNPNPFIAKDEDFAKAAAKAGLDYDALIQKILNFATH